MRRLCLLTSAFCTIPSFHKALHQPKEPRTKPVLAVPRNQMLQWAPGFQMYPGLRDRDELVAN